MSQPADSNKPEQTSRMKAILDAGREAEVPPAAKAEKRAPLDRLPRAERKAAPPPQPTPVQPRPKRMPRERTPARERLKRLGPPFWTVTGTISLIVDAVLIGIIIILWFQVSKLNLQINKLLSLGDMPVQLVSGLYANFEQMEDAHIETKVKVPPIPVKFDLSIAQSTQVVLSEDTSISGARVTLQTGGLNIINAPTSIVLPAGTVLPITLQLLVPVDTSVPVDDIQVDIPLAQTDLQTPFAGLQETLEPLYCLLKPDAKSIHGMPICQ